jgi:hypothetical protein
MRSVRILRWALVPAILATLAVGPGASATQGAAWSGTTDPQGLPLKFSVAQQGTRTVITEMSFSFDMRCEDGQTFGMQITFAGLDVPIVHKRFSFVYTELGQALQWKGKFHGPVRVSGTLQSAIPGLTRNVRPELCQSKLQTFTAHPSGAAAGVGQPFHADVSVVVARDAFGAVRVATTNR